MYRRSPDLDMIGLRLFSFDSKKNKKKERKKEREKKEQAYKVKIDEQTLHQKPLSNTRLFLKLQTAQLSSQFLKG